MIAIDSLSKSRGSLRVLHEVSLAGAEGGVTALVGDFERDRKSVV